MQPLVSICIPTYNRPDGLKRLLDSIQQQIFRDYEIIISDDTSNSEIIQSVVKTYQDLPISYYHHASSLGTPANWNFALDKANGKYVKLMHDDDWFLSADALEILVKTAEDSDADIVVCQSANYVDGHIEHLNIATAHDLEMLKKDVFVLFDGNFLSAPSATLCKASKIRYDEKIKWYVDIEYYVQIIHNGVFQYVGSTLIGINANKGRVSDICMDNKDVIYREFFYCRHKLISQGVITTKKSRLWLDSFFVNNNIQSYKDFAPYCLDEKFIVWLVYMRYKLRNVVRRYKHNLKRKKFNIKQ